MELRRLFEIFDKMMVVKINYGNENIVGRICDLMYHPDYQNLQYLSVVGVASNKGITLIILH